MIALASPDIREEDIKAVVDTLRTGMLVQGCNVAALETFAADYLGTTHVVALANGTATMHLALIAAGVGPGDEVIVPAFSYVATANVVELVGAKPVFVDVKADTFNIDAAKIEAVITDRTKAIIPVHEFGLPCDIVKIMEIANEHGLIVIEDAACALGATAGEKKVGTFGHFASFSLHPRKAISSGEGGLLVCRNEEHYHKIRTLRNHGIDSTKPTMDFIEAGFNYRMTDFQAALVLSQFKRLDATLVLKEQLAEAYHNELSNSTLSLPSVPLGCTHTWQTYHVILPQAVDQAHIIQKMKEAGVGTNYGAQCIPSMSFYARKYDLDSKALFPNAFRSYMKGLALPLYEKLNNTHIQTISQTLKQVLNNATNA